MQSNPQLEHEVLGSLLQPGADPEVVNDLKREMFTETDTITVFETIKALADSGDEFNAAAVMSWQNVNFGYGSPKCTNPSVLVQWMTRDGNVTRLHVLADALRNLYELNRLEAILQTALMKVQTPDSLATNIRESVLAELNGIDLGGSEDIVPMAESMAQLAQVIRDNQDDGTRHDGYPTGLPHIDAESPMPEQGLAIIAGGTSHGKSAMASAIALTAACRGISVGYISLEMSAVSLTARAIAQHGGRKELEFPVTATGVVSADHMRRRRLDEGEQLWVQRYREEMQRLGVADRYYLTQRCDESLTSIKSLIRKMACQRKARIVVVDYLQLIQTDGTYRNETQEHFMARCARDLKNLGDRYGILIIALSQLNRDVLSVRPTINRLRDSGQIAEAADWVMLLWRPEAVAPNVTFDGDWKPLPTRGLGMVIVAKNREGRLYEEVVRWIGRSTLYYEDDLYMQSLWDKINAVTDTAPPRQEPVQTELDFTAMME